MESIRFPLIAALAVVCFFLYQAWQQDQAPAPEPASLSPIDQVDVDDDVPTLAASPTRNEEPTLAPDADTPAVVEPSTQQVVVETDVMRAFIDPQGGNLVRVELLDYPVEADSDVPLAVLHQGSRGFFVVQTGLLGADAPTHKAAYTAQRTRYRLSGDQALEVPLTWTGADGRPVPKRYRFEPGRYVIGLDYQVRNASQQPWSVSAYGQVWRTPADAGGGTPFVRQFEGAAWYEQKDGEAKYRFPKADFGKIEG